eukprot:849444-Alexandrium_andersonii.AAC.1
MSPVSLQTSTSACPQTYGPPLTAWSPHPAMTRTQPRRSTSRCISGCAPTWTRPSPWMPIAGAWCTTGVAASGTPPGPSACSATAALTTTA